MNSESSLHCCTIRRVMPFLVMAIAGCGGSEDGPPRAAVSGIVTLDGQPLKTGTIRFVPNADTPGPKVSVGLTDGVFAVPADIGPVVGHHRVEIEAPTSGEIANDDESALERLKKQGRKARLKVVRIPAVYNINSKLTADVSESGPNELSFQLLSKTHR